MPILLALLLSLGLQCPGAAIGPQSLPSGLPPGLQVQIADLEQMLAANNGRTEVFVHRRYPRIYVLDFVDLQTQADTFNRIAAYIELAAAPRDRILASSELRHLLKGLHRNWAGLYGGHDYRLSDLARFYNQAQRQKMPLVAGERALLNLLLSQKLLRLQAGAYTAVAPDAALISFVEDEPGLPASSDRRMILQHELRHGRYFTDAAYRAASLDFWQGLSRSEREGFMRFLKANGYDIANQDLLLNEFQAYLSTSQTANLAMITRLTPDTITRLKAGLERRLNQEARK